MVGAALVFGACSSPAGLDSDAAALMVTDAAAYQLVSGPSGEVMAIIGYTYSNRTGRPVSIPNCLGDVPPHLEKLVEGTWVVAWGAPTLDCLSPPVTIQPGEQYRDGVRLRAWPPDSDVRPKFVVDPIEGVYRLVWADAVWNYDASGPPWGDPLPLAQRVSNRFDLLEP